MLNGLFLYKLMFCTVSLIAFGLIVFGKLFVFKKKDAIFVSDYTSSIALFFSLFVILSIVGLFLTPSIYKSLAFLFFALSPFLIGLVAKYETEKYFTLLQLFIFILSVVFVLEV